MDNVVKFNKPYMFEGNEYTEVDLSGLDNLKTTDLIEADKVFVVSGQIATVKEMNVGYACILAAKVSSKPLEFYQGLPAKDAIKVKNVVTRFLLGQD